MAKTRELPAMPDDFPDAVAAGKPGGDALGWLTAMLQLASQGDEHAGKRVMEACRTVPKLWEMISVLSGQAERAWVDLITAGSPPNELARQTVARDITRKRQEVAGEAPTPLEALLAERVALAWVAASFADEQYAVKLKAGMSFKEGEYHAKRCEQAHRQLLRSVEALARVRRLLRPTVQINLAEQQINLAP